MIYFVYLGDWSSKQPGVVGTVQKQFGKPASWDRRTEKFDQYILISEWIVRTTRKHW